MKRDSSAYEHVLTSMAQQIQSSQSVLNKLRRGARKFPRLAIFPAVLSVLAITADLGVWAIGLSIAATSALLVGAVTYTLVEKRLVAAIKTAVRGLDALTKDEQEKLLQHWLR